MIPQSDYKNVWFKEDLADLEKLADEIEYLQKRRINRTLECESGLVVELQEIIELHKLQLKNDIKKMEDDYGIKADKFLSPRLRKTLNVKGQQTTTSNNIIASIKPEDLGLA